MDLPHNIDPATGLDMDLLLEYISECAQAWAETEKAKNQTIGESRCEQELAFRAAMDSEKSEKIGKSEKWIWLTINPKPEITLPKFITTIQKLYQKRWIDQYAYVYETTENNHFHSHGLIKCFYEPARARKELANTVKDITTITNHHCFKFVILDSDKAAQKMNYMLGFKKPSKMSGVEITKKWREEEMLKSIYENEERPILLVPREQLSEEFL